MRRTLIPCALLLSLIILGCSGNKGTNSTGTGIQGTWPTDAVGRYERTVERRFCPGNPLGCQYRLLLTDTVEVCGDPTDAFVAEYLKGWSFPSSEVTGEISDSLYVAYFKFPDTPNCYWYLTLSTEGTHQPPSKNGWQFTVVFDTDCQEWYAGTDRFTYTRIDDGDCPAEGQ